MFLLIHMVISIDKPSFMNQSERMNDTFETFFVCRNVLKSKVNWYLTLVQKYKKSSIAQTKLCKPKAKLRLEVLFKKFHPKINLATLFSTKSYLLNRIKPFSRHENRSLTKSQIFYKKGTLRNLNPWTSFSGHENRSLTKSQKTFKRGVWNILKVLVSHQNFWNCFFS
jgi:hypothetical protein